MTVGPQTAEFESIIRFIEQQTGIRLPETHYRQVRSYLEVRTADLGLDIRGFIERVATDRSEWETFIDAVTINETYFFREERHFLTLAQHVFPVFDQNAARPLLFWSAACATGEEALSLAALANGWWSQSDIGVYASDINQQALAHFRRGIYGGNAFREDGSCYHSLLRTDPPPESKSYRVPAEWFKTITVLPVNLSAPVYHGIPQGLHLVFLRNMLIYIKFEGRLAIVDRITRHMAEGGYLFLSSAEVPLLAHPDLVLENHCGCYFFRKKTFREKQDGTRPRPVVLTHQQSTPLIPADRSRTGENRRPSVPDILRHVHQRLNNPLYIAPDDALQSAVVAYLEAVYLLNAAAPVKAQTAIDGLIKDWGANEITDYLQGLVALRLGNPAEAGRWFETALYKDPGFWPAVFQEGLLLVGTQPKRALKAFTACLRGIEAYIARDAFTYQFLLEGFNARYFGGICQGWIAKLQSKGAADGA
jgi:chemotaxis protein methyltransferase CheR